MGTRPDPEAVSAVMLIEDRHVRRAALEGLHPGLVALVDAAVGDPEKFRDIDERLAEAALSCLDIHDAIAATSADTRPSTGWALQEVHGDAVDEYRQRLDTQAPGAVNPSELRTWTTKGLVTGEAAEAYARRCGGARHLASVASGIVEQQPHLRSGTDDERGKRLFREVMRGTHRVDEDGLRELAWGVLGRGAPVQWWKSAGPLNTHAVQLMWNVSLDAAVAAAAIDAAGLDDDAAHWILYDGPAYSTQCGRRRPQGGTPYLSDDELVLVDRALGHIRRLGGAVQTAECTAERTVGRTAERIPEFTTDADAAIDALEHLASPELERHVRGQLLAGRYGRMTHPQHLAWLDEAGATGEQTAQLVGDELLGEWAAHTDPRQWAGVLAHCHSSQAVDAVDSLAWADQHRREHAPHHLGSLEEFAAACAEHVPGALTLVAGTQWGDAPVSRAVMERLADQLGDHPVAWQALWRLADSWPGTVDDAVECIRACQHP